MVHVVVHVHREFFPGDEIILLNIELPITEHKIVLKMLFPYRMVHFLEISQSILHQSILIIEVQQSQILV